MRHCPTRHSWWTPPSPCATAQRATRGGRHHRHAPRGDGIRHRNGNAGGAVLICDDFRMDVERFREVRPHARDGVCRAARRIQTDSVRPIEAAGLTREAHTHRNNGGPLQIGELLESCELVDLPAHDTAGDATGNTASETNARGRDLNDLRYRAN